MLISGIQQCTLIDYPEKIACIVFTPGCDFRCGYCHNPEFVLPKQIACLRSSFIPEEAFFNFLQERRTVLDGVVVSGGEPTLRPDLLPFLARIKSLGFLVKLDTNGNRPEVLRRVIDEHLVDYIAMDVKTSLPEYQNLVGKMATPERIAESIEILKSSGIDYEFRSTLIQEVHSPQILQDMAKLLHGAHKLFLQSFRPNRTLDPVFETYHPFSSEQMNDIARMFEKEVEEVRVR